LKNLGATFCVLCEEVTWVGRSFDFSDLDFTSMKCTLDVELTNL